MRAVYSIDVDCANCARAVEEAIRGVDGVNDASISFMELRMELDVDGERFDEVIAAVGEAAASAEPDFRFWPIDEDDERPEEEDEGGGWAVPRIAAGLAFVALGLAMEHICAPDIPALALQAVYLAALVAVGFDVFRSGIRTLLKGGFLDEHLLMAVATVAAVCIHCYTESMAVMTFYLIGEWFEDRAVGSSRRDVKRLLDLKSTRAAVIRGDATEIVHPREIAVGDRVVVAPGELFPVDGTVVEGESFADTKAMTGEPVPRRISVGDEVLGGYINTDSVVIVSASRVYSDSAAKRMMSLIEESASRKSRSEKLITRFARVYTPVVVACAFVLAIGGGLLTGDWGSWVEKGVIFLVVSCPCALVVSVPLTYFCGIGNASRNGILVKGSMCMETLAGASAAVFDKTGTLTDGAFEVRSVEPAPGFTEERLLDAAVCAEMFSTHPIARSIIDHAGAIPDATRIEDSMSIAGKGVSALVDDVPVIAGNRSAMEDIGLHPDAPDPAFGTVVHVAIDGRYAGRIAISDRVKDDSASAVSSLRSMGIRTCMLTGDGEAAGREIADRVGVDGFEAGLLPEGKIARLEEIMAGTGGATVFVGDGINDSPALARADAGIAMGALGSDAAVEAADAVIVDDRPSRIPQAISIARRTRRIVIQNIALALAAKFAIMIATPFGYTDMWIAIIGDVGILILCVLNAARAMGMSRSERRIAVAEREELLGRGDRDCGCGCCDHDHCHDHDHDCGCGCCDHGHEHCHDHDHEHCHDHDHEHCHDHGHEHCHDHGHEHCHDHDHEHCHDHDHEHCHDHGHEHCHDHGHEHCHDHGHEHCHDHGHDCGCGCHGRGHP